MGGGVWVGAQRGADERIPVLLEIPARIRFLSCEPLLEAVDILNVNIQGIGGPDGLYLDSLRAVAGYDREPRGKVMAHGGFPFARRPSVD